MHEIILYEQTTGRTLLTLNQISDFVGLHPDMIHRLFVLGLIDAQIERPVLLFDDTVVTRIKKIQRLKNDLGINLAGCGLVLDLLDRIAEIENALLYYERRTSR